MYIHNLFGSSPKDTFTLSVILLSPSYRLHHMEVMKRKRTKRPRQPSPLTLIIASTSSSNMTKTTSAEFTDRTEEEEDMANCLILLAQSNVDEQLTPSPAAPVITSCHTFYQCKTCDRYFPSFQALGGHRASHKKPKSAEVGEKRQFNVTVVEDNLEYTDLSLRISSDRGTLKKSRVHECTMCGAEFSSGQALGGHMRRHRPIPIANCEKEMKKSKNVLPLDLNLPAPEDGHGESTFGFGSKDQLIVFSAASLLDCHY